MSALPCAAADWPRFSALLDEAIDLGDDERTRWLESLAGDDVRLKPLLAEMLGNAAAAETSDFQQPPPLRAPDAFSPGDIVGPYRLESPLGEGGMGVVWRSARADDGPKREVALKLPHADFLGPAFKRRFARERDVLAALSHPNIAQLYEAGASAEGHPYLALELVEGTPITAWCRARSAPLAQRVDLIRQVLAGLGYAHQRLIVHRDIKPGNVLVTPDGRVKLLDFGIAKLLGPETGGEVALTQMARPATPAYAAPEQLAGGAITVAADVYAAGVLLFELCAGQRPFARAPVVDGEGAPLASARADAAAAGAPEGRRLAALLRGDLDAILARALSLNPAGRYATAEAFADDLYRWRTGLPVRARRIGWLTRTRKFARRNRLGVVLGGVLVLSVAGGTAGIAWQARLAAAQARLATAQALLAGQQAARANAIKDFMIGLFEAGDPRGGGKRPDEMTARALLDRGADRLDSAFAADRETRIALLKTLGGIYDVLDDSARALALWSRRLALAQELHGDTDPAVIDDAMDLAGSEAEALDFTDAQALLAHFRAPILRSQGAHSLAYARWLNERARALRATPGARDEIVADLNEAIGLYRSHESDPAIAAQSGTYAAALYQLEMQQVDAEQFAASFDLLRRMRAIQQRFEPGDVIDTLEYLNGTADALEMSGKLDAADALYAASQRQAARSLGPRSDWCLTPLMHRASLAGMRGDLARAGELFHQAGADSPAAISWVRRGYLIFLVRTGRGGDAVKPLEAALASARGAGERDEGKLRIVEAYLGEAYWQAGQIAEARQVLQAAAADWRREGVPGVAATLVPQERWGAFLLDRGEPAAAADIFRAVLAQGRGAASAPAARAAAGLARVALAAGDVPAAGAQSVAALRLLDATTQEYDVRARIDVWMARAEVLWAEGNQPEAQGWAAKAASAADSDDAPGTARPIRAHALLARIAAGPPAKR